MSGGYFVWVKNGKPGNQVSFRDFEKERGTQGFTCEVNANEALLVCDPDDLPTHVTLEHSSPGSLYILDLTQPPIIVDEDDGLGGSIVHATFK